MHLYQNYPQICPGDTHLGKYQIINIGVGLFVNNRQNIDWNNYGVGPGQFGDVYVVNYL